jgi:hypothetical protein
MLVVMEHRHRTRRSIADAIGRSVAPPPEPVVRRAGST